MSSEPSSVVITPGWPPTCEASGIGLVVGDGKGEGMGEAGGDMCSIVAIGVVPVVVVVAVERVEL